MTSRGRVRVWHAEDGWGVIDSPDTPGGCWSHFSSVLVSGYKSLLAAEAVEFTFEAAEQDGYAFRAVEVWRADDEPIRRDDDVAGAGFHSTLSLTFGDEDA